MIHTSHKTKQKPKHNYTCMNVGLHIELLIKLYVKLKKEQSINTTQRMYPKTHTLKEKQHCIFTDKASVNQCVSGILAHVCSRGATSQQRAPRDAELNWSHSISPAPSQTVRGALYYTPPPHSLATQHPYSKHLLFKTTLFHSYPLALSLLSPPKPSLHIVPYFPKLTCYQLNSAAPFIRIK